MLRLLTRSARVAMAVATAWVMIVGPVMYAQLSYGLHRFGGVEYVPRVVALAVTRGWGPWGATVAAALGLTGLLHDRTIATSRDGRRAWHPEWTAVAGAAVAVPVLYTPVCALVIASTMLVAWAADALGPSTFFVGLHPADVACGIGWSLLGGAFAAAWALFGRRVWGAQWALWRKLLLTFGVFLSGSALWGFLVSLVYAVLGGAQSSPG